MYCLKWLNGHYIHYDGQCGVTYGYSNGCHWISDLTNDVKIISSHQRWTLCNLLTNYKLDTDDPGSKMLRHGANIHYELYGTPWVTWKEFNMIKIIEVIYHILHLKASLQVNKEKVWRVQRQQNYGMEVDIRLIRTSFDVNPIVYPPPPPPPPPPPLILSVNIAYCFDWYHNHRLRVKCTQIENVFIETCIDMILLWFQFS